MIKKQTGKKGFVMALLLAVKCDHPTCENAIVQYEVGEEIEMRESFSNQIHLPKFAIGLGWGTCFGLHYCPKHKGSHDLSCENNY